MLDGLTSKRATLGFVGCCLLAGVALGLAGAYAWQGLANPPSGTLERRGVFFGEQQLDQQVGVTLWFLVVGAFLGIASGAVVGLVGRLHGVVVVAGVLLMCAVASGLSARLGSDVFGVAGKAQLAGAEEGTTFTSRLSITSSVAYLGWPLGGLVGAVLAILTWPVPESPRVVARMSSTFVPE